MAITRGAKKAHRTSIKKRTFNLARKNQVTKTSKALKKLITAGDKKAAQAAFVLVQKALDKAVKGKTIKKNTASRSKSRLSKLVKKIS